MVLKDQFAQPANNPWDRYLQARREAIAYMRDKLQYDDNEIVLNINILPTEVNLILKEREDATPK